MAAFEVFVPPLDDYEERQAAIGIEPEELTVLGLSLIGQVPHKYVKSCSLVDDYGYVMPYSRGGRDYYIRGLYLSETAIDVVGIPRRPEELGAHLRWYQEELTRLEHRGITTPEHLPVIVKDEDRWGECGYGIFTLAEAVQGTCLAVAMKRRRPGSQKPAMEAIGKIFDYYQDVDRPIHSKPIRDLWPMRQYIGQSLVDLDPLRSDVSDFPEELAHLSEEARQLRSKSGKALQERIFTEWIRQQDIAISNIGK